MKIAIIGWGSLIWCPGALQIASRWHRGGPSLPLEFARISGDGRLTLVIHRANEANSGLGSELRSPTFWVMSSMSDVPAAREDLSKRERTPTLNPIHAVNLRGEIYHKKPSGVERDITSWLAEPAIQKHNIEAAVWTGLESNWVKKRGHEFTIPDALAYVREQELEKDRAEADFLRLREYIQNAPNEIDTEVRRELCKQNGWYPSSLPAVLFEQSQNG